MSAIDNKSSLVTRNFKDKTGRPRRKWRRRVLLVVLLLVIALVWASPYLASTGPGTRLILSIVSSRLQGKVEADNLSLSWLGPCEVENLRILDPAAREVLSVKQIKLARGVLNLLISAENFEELGVDSPLAALYVDADGQISLAEALKSREAKPPEEKEPPEKRRLPAPKGRISCQRGAVKIVQADGRAYDIHGISAQLDLDTLNDIAGSLQLSFVDGGKLAGDIDVTGLVSDNEIRLEKAKGSASIRTEEDINVGALAKFATGESGIKGKTRLDVKVEFEQKGFLADFMVQVADLHTEKAGGAHTKPADLQINGHLGTKDGKTFGQIAFIDDFAEVHADFTFAHADRPVELSYDNLLSAALTGEPLGLPDFTFELKGNADLAALAQAVPGILKIRPQIEIVDGRLNINNLSLRGGPAPSASGDIELKGLVAHDGKQEIRWAPISAGFDMLLEPGKGLEIRRADLESDFARIEASGTPAKIQAQFSADLAKLHNRINEIFEAGDFELAGRLTSKLELARAGDGRVDLALDAAADALQYKAGEQKLDIEAANLHCSGNLALVGKKVTRIVATDLRAELGPDVVATATGWHDFQGGGYHADVELKRAELARIVRLAQGLGGADFGRYTGLLDVKTSIDSASRDAPAVLAGSAVVQNLHMDETLLAKADVTLRWSDVEVSPKTNQFSAASVKLTSELANLTAEDIRYQSGDRPRLAGKIDLVADLARCLPVCWRIAAGKEPPTAVAGSLTWSAGFVSSADAIAIKSDGQIDNLQIGTGPKSVREERINLVNQTEIDLQNETLRLNKMEIRSKTITSDVTGTVKKYKTDRILDLSGRYRLSWKDLTALLHQFVPETKDTVSFAGSATSNFKITGPAYRPEARPVFRGVDGSASVGWTSAEIYGLALGEAKLSPVLAEGQVKLPVTAVAASDGTLRVGGLIDFGPQEPTLRLAGKTQVLENVEIKPEVGRYLLSRFNPVFADLAHLEGRVSLTVDDLELPLGSGIKQSGKGRGHLDLTQMKVGPGGLLADLLNLSGSAKDKTYTIKVDGVDFAIKDGRIEYDNFTLVFSDVLQMKFYGSVGFDDTLDLAVSVPIGPEIFRKLEVSGPIEDYARLLAGVRIDIPIVGTRLKPKLDLAGVDILPLVERAIRAYLAEQIQKKAKNRGETPDDKNAPERPGDRLLDDLLDILEDHIERSRKDEGEKPK